jgi:hypothetical protein
MASLPAAPRSVRALAPPALALIAATLGLGAGLHGSAHAEPPDARAGKGAGGSSEGAACAGRWSTSGAARTRRTRLKSWRVQLDLPRASAACTDALERQLLDELRRALPTPATADVLADAACHLAYAEETDLAWACRLHWRGDARAPLSAIVGISGSGSPSGVRFHAPFAGCSADARKAIVADAIDGLTPRLREPAAEIARTHPALLTAYREGETLRVSFGRAMPHEDMESTLGRVPWERMVALCGAKE